MRDGERPAERVGRRLADWAKATFFSRAGWGATTQEWALYAGFLSFPFCEPPPELYEPPRATRAWETSP